MTAATGECCSAAAAALRCAEPSRAGIAATHISGTTLHTLAGVGVPQTMRDFKKMNSNVNASRLRALELLMIDEVSMISAEFLTALERGIREVRGDERPWGGIQMVFSGDFAQLPPISQRPSPTLPPDAFLNRGYAFQAPIWNRADTVSVVLTKVFRQADEEFVAILNSIREGRGQAAIAALQRRCSRPLPAIDGIRPTELYSRNSDVDAVNARELDAITDAELQTYSALDAVQSKEETRLEATDDQRARRNDAKIREQEQQLRRHEFWNNCAAAGRLQLKLSAQVMLLRNLELTGGAGHMLVNGSRGVVSNIVSCDAVRQELHASLASLKSGKLPAGELAGKRISEALVLQERRLKRMDEWCQSPGNSTLPVVKFRNGVERVMYPEAFEHTVHDVGVCARTQVPLRAAWAMSIHKSQGLSLDFVKVSLNNLFAEGQCYVALSRVRTLDGLQIMGNATANGVRVSDIVRRFYQCISRGETYTDDAWRFFTACNGTEREEERMQPAGGGAGPAHGQKREQVAMGEWNEKAPAQKKQAPAAAGGIAAFFTPLGAPKAQPGRGGGRGGGGGGGSGACFKCGDSGHWSRDCPKGGRGGGGGGGGYGGGGRGYGGGY